MQDTLMCIQMGKTVDDPTGCALRPGILSEVGGGDGLALPE